MDKPEMQARIEQLEAELKCVEDLNALQFETIIDLNIENITLNDKVVDLQNSLFLGTQEQVS